jgi:hypothetical protein
LGYLLKAIIMKKGLFKTVLQIRAKDFLSIFFLVQIFTFSSNSKVWSQLLGFYEFTGVSNGDNQLNSVTSQPDGATFSAFTRVGVNWVSGTDVFNSNGFDVSLNANKYVTFTITPSNFIALHELSWTMDKSGNSGSWALRSSLDGFSANLATGAINGSISILLPSGFQNLSAPVSFRIYAFNLQNNGGNPATSRTVTIDNVKLFGMTCPSFGCLSYCRPTSDASIDFINHFTTSGGDMNISNLNTGFSSPGYADYTNHFVSHTAGGTVNFSLTAGSAAYTYGVAIWVDWNKNGIFEAGEKVHSNGNTYNVCNPYTGSFVCPLNADMDDYRMRVAIDYYGTGTNMTPCQFVLGSTGPAPGRFGEAEDYTLRITGILLPVELTSFSAHCKDQNAEVRWTTASEQNSSHFELERSADGLNWSKVVTTEAAGNSNITQEYYYVDNENGRNFEGYYRLTQVDLDGKSTTYNPIMVSCMGEKESALTVQPNPTTANAQFTASGFNSGNAQFCIQDVSGKRIVERQLELNNGTMAFTADLSTCAPGIYIAKLIDQNGESKTVRIIKD